jgi:hypothetical protein
MSKHYFFFAALLAAFSAGAQSTAPQIPVAQRTPQVLNKTKFIGTEPVANIPVNQHHTGDIEVTNHRDVTVVQELIGITIYDLQTNGAVQRRVVQNDDEIRGAWTFGLTQTAFDDRGTGFNEYVGGSWNEEPYERIENVRSGWPSLLETASGRTLAISHADVDTPLHMVYRNAGSSNWVDTDLPAGDEYGQLWPRAAVGGEDGNSIHVICVTTPVANGGIAYNGQDGGLLYFRSTDAGDTWEIQGQQFPELGSDFFLNLSADAYAIHARGNKVAFAVFNDFADSFVMISEDNGNTWEYRSLVDFPVDLYVVDSGLPEIGDDWDEDGLFQEFFNTDGSGDVIIDNDGKVHVFYGEMYYADTDLTDGNFQYYPGVNGLAYWNEDMDDNMREVIAFTYDLDDSGTLDLDGIALYFTNLAGMPSAGVTADGSIYVTYSAVMESHSTGSLNFRHMHVVRSLDGGSTWSTESACNLTPDVEFDFYESVFGSMSADINDEVHIVYQRDFEPGLHIRGEEHPAGINDMVYLRVALDQFEACEAGEDIEYTAIEEALQPSDIEIFPNPAQEVVNIVLNKLGTADLRIYDLTGKVVFERQNAQSFVRVNTQELAAGSYVVTVSTLGGTVSQKLMID